MSRIWFAALAALGAVASALVAQAGAFNPQPEPPGFEVGSQGDVDGLPAVAESTTVPGEDACRARGCPARGACVAVNQLERAAQPGRCGPRQEGRSRARRGGGWRQLTPYACSVQDPNATAVAEHGRPRPTGAGAAGRRHVQRRQRADPFTSHRRPFTPRLGDGSSISTWEWTGSARPRGVVGKPNVPALTRFFALPVGADVSVNLLGSSSYVLDGIHLWPQQDEAADPTAVEFSAPGVRDRSEDIRERRGLPGEPRWGVGQVGTLRDLRLGGVETDGARSTP